MKLYPVALARLYSWLHSVAARERKTARRFPRNIKQKQYESERTI